ncbi:MAG: GGDEF domain-containing protein [Phycisphaerales bacterium]|nr:GGDEF domain-containing protein [Phycisphaerales bacterium]
MGDNRPSGSVDAADLKARLSSVIASRALRVVFQPILEFRTGLVAAREGLIRPLDGGPFPHTGALFEAAERVGMLGELERACLEVIFSAAQDLPPGEFLFVNLSPSVFADPRIVDDVAAICRNCSRLEPSHVTIELTERNEAASVEMLAAQADAFRDRGFQFAIDDVGAGTSGLNRIMRLRPNWLKLDRELISNLDADPFRRNLLQFFVHFARLSSMLLLAEGIEREEELRTAIDLGVAFGQGFLIARPAAAANQGVDPLWVEVIPHMQHRMEQRRFEDPRMAPIGELAQPLISCPAEMTVADAAELIGHLSSAATLAVLDGQRVLGAVAPPRIREACKADPEATLGRLCRPGVIVASPDMTIAETIDWAVLRPDSEIMEPILVASEDVVGMLSMRSLIMAAGKMRPEGSPHTASLTGLPNRVQLDWQIQRRQDQRAATSAAVIDIRFFNRYNRAYGFEMGDTMLRQLAALLMLHFGEREADEFIAHVTDDHFIIISPRADLKVRMQVLAAEFDRSRSQFFSAEELKRESFAAPGQPPGRMPLCSLRAFVVAEILNRICSSSDLMDVSRRGRRREDAGSVGHQSTVKVVKIRQVKSCRRAA